MPGVYYLLSGRELAAFIPSFQALRCANVSTTCGFRVSAPNRSARKDQGCWPGSHMKETARGSGAERAGRGQAAAPPWCSVR